MVPVPGTYGQAVDRMSRMSGDGAGWSHVSFCHGLLCPQAGRGLTLDVAPER